MQSHTFYPDVYPWKRALLANGVAFYLFAIMPILRYVCTSGGGSYGSFPVTVVQYMLLALFIFLIPSIYRKSALIPARRISTCLLCFVFLYLVIAYATIEIHSLLYSYKFEEWKKEVVVIPFALSYFAFGVFYGAYKDERFIAASFLIQAAFVLAVVGIPQVVYGVSIFDKREMIDYQYWGDGFAILALMFVTTRRATWLLMLSMLAAIAVLYFIPSRSSLLCTVIALAVYLLMRFKWGVLISSSAVVVVTVFVVVGIGTRFDIVGFFENQTFSRQTHFLVQGEDSSLESRRHYSATGLETISNYPLLGQYGYELEKYSQVGTYMHNVMDIWAKTGIVPFLLFSAVIFMSVRYVWSRRSLASDHDRLTAISMLVFSISSLILARNHGSIHLLFGIGAGVGVAILARRASSVEPEARFAGFIQQPAS